MNLYLCCSAICYSWSLWVGLQNGHHFYFLWVLRGILSQNNGCLSWLYAFIELWVLVAMIENFELIRCNKVSGFWILVWAKFIFNGCHKKNKFCLLKVGLYFIIMVSVILLLAYLKWLWRVFWMISILGNLLSIIFRYLWVDVDFSFILPLVFLFHYELHCWSLKLSHYVSQFSSLQK